MLDIFRYGSKGITISGLVCVYEFETKFPMYFMYEVGMHSHFAGNVAGVILDPLGLLSGSLLLLLLAFKNQPMQ